MPSFNPQNPACAPDSGNEGSSWEPMLISSKSMSVTRHGLLLLISQWPEMSHTVSRSCKGGWDMESWCILCSEKFQPRGKCSSMQLNSCSLEPPIIFPEPGAFLFASVTLVVWLAGEVFASKYHPKLGNPVSFCFSETVTPVSWSFEDSWERFLERATLSDWWFLFQSPPNRQLWEPRDRSDSAWGSQLTENWWALVLPQGQRGEKNTKQVLCSEMQMVKNRVINMISVCKGCCW